MKSIQSQLAAFGVMIILICGAGGYTTYQARLEVDHAATAQVAAADAMNGHMMAVFLNEEARTIAHSTLIFNEFTADERKAFESKIKSYSQGAQASVADYGARARAEVEKNLKRPLPAEVHANMREQLALLATYHRQLDAMFRAEPWSRAEVVGVVAAANETRSRLGGMRRAIGDALIARRDALAKQRQEATQAQAYAILGTFALIMVMVGAFSMFAARKVRRFSTRVEQALADMKAGRDISVGNRIGVASEFTVVARALEDMQSKNRELEGMKARETEALNSRADRADSLETAVAEFESTVRTVVSALKGSAASMHNSSVELISATSIAQKGADSLAAVSEAADSAAHIVASATTEMSAGSNALMSRLDATVSVVEQAATSASSTRASVEMLDSSAQKIGEVVALIRSIAEQTNLLALNATIEAARAGESGRGFAVVAGEVKSLAARTAQATEDIAGQIGAIQETATHSAQSIRVIAEAVQQVAKQMQEMSAMIEQQDVALRQVSEAAEMSKNQTNTLRDGAGNIAGWATEASQSAGMIGTAANDIDKTSQQIDEAVRSFLKRVAA